MIASEHCTDSLYDSQYHSIKMSSEYNNFKSELHLMNNNNNTSPTNEHIPMNETPTSNNNMPCISSTPSSSWYSANNNNNNNHYPDPLFYANLPPPHTTLTTTPHPLSHSSFTFPPTPTSLIPPQTPPFSSTHPLNLNLNHLKKYNHTKRHPHPRHHSANGILQQYHPPHHLNHQPFTYHPYHRRPSSTSPNMPNSLTTSPSSTTLSSLSPTHPIHHLESLDKSSSLRYQIVLQACTAAAQRFSESSLTYLNRGQAYSIHFQDTQQNNNNSNNHNHSHNNNNNNNNNNNTNDCIITSTISITFHDATHRQASQNYWRFWLSQQERPNDARALDIDSQQSTGILSVHYPSFDRILFTWSSQAGANVFIRFNCLSTDFSRIKGVKGIPLRVLVESSSSLDNHPHDNNNDPIKTENNEPTHLDAVVEKSYCKIKLFRDKGAERKNKDDAKQISKQLEKLKAEGNPQNNPLWHLYNRPVSQVSLFESLPDDDATLKDEYSTLTSTSPNSRSYSLPTMTNTTTNNNNTNNNNNNTSTTITNSPPLPLSPSNHLPILQQSQSSDVNNNNNNNNENNTITENMNNTNNNNNNNNNNNTMNHSLYPTSFPTSMYQSNHHPSSFVQASPTSFMFNPMTPSISSTTSPPTTPTYVYPTNHLSHQNSNTCELWPQLSHPPPLPSHPPSHHMNHMKRSRSLMVSYNHPTSPENPPMKKLHTNNNHSNPSHPVNLTIFVDTKNESSTEAKRIELETLTLQHLTGKLSGLFSLQANRVTEVFWKKDPSLLDMHSSPSLNHNTNNNNSSSKKSNHHLHQLIQLDDNMIADHILDRTKMIVNWEISSAGMVRLILEF
ncbi:unnamed protein product [Cunninghamella blakesleeana]